ncbi:4-(cytidine 5'-diphospho)-2-C-methyl-D-erythritol kinase [Nitrospira moscoviensis]|uniref:4-diphosphocytidyl-2-C-methyl-D-erythritol kinase n=1 Tax=Nitrospira moscoviensis TaxID=42253 RepID=A0A0K2G7X7_NITMO|nr:4-(cytidine 5'-diphospho)-2-C-methyl-D-erythritol kinase [Nitrospira moscoviensis]ALA57076.1 4-diphosphocytidyl-2-C-methyl-D-erythritol kinase [Nitrospira moscoviensis]
MTSPATPTTAVSVLAPAKVNLILRILDRRPDGFHNLWSLMQTVRLEDTVSVRLSDEHEEIRLHCDAPGLAVDHTNLVYRAAAAALRRSGRSVGLTIALGKRIPMGAGLGGGSSDAAATILALNQLLNLGWTVKDMMEVGQALGSDVPFFFTAPSAFVSGRGEQVAPVRLVGSKWVVLVNPGFPVETKWAYHRLSSTRAAVRPLSPAQAALAGAAEVSWNTVLPLMENDFETPVFDAHPILRQIRTRLLAEGAEAALLSGSGATVFGLFADEATAVRAAASFQYDTALTVFVVPVGSGPLACRV